MATLMATSPPTSTRFRRAARTERDRLARQREKVAARSDNLKEELATLAGQMQELDERIQSLESLIGEGQLRSVALPTPAPTTGNQTLKGGEIRIAAVRLLINSGRADASIHYRQWLELLCDSGYRVAGKRPDAVFLSQIIRSPVVRATTKAGVYELDFDAPDRLGRNLESLQHELSGLVLNPSSNRAELAKRTARQEEIGLEIRRTQKALTEATESLGEAPAHPSTQLAA